MSNVVFTVEPQLPVEEFIDVLRRSTLAERRPVDSRETMQRMLSHADIIVAARVSGELVGVARSLTDFCYCTYLADLAVDVAWQRQGIGRQLIARTHQEAGRETLLILLSAPAAVDYYPHIGFERHPACWTLPRTLPSGGA